ncbi:hypothetical protein, partial [uncultured Rhodoblastus sp.]|uniref:hypothetical protein n=1 Tax=uncultured Rhodoblastus sp. TaxID=543037 RepID=UPI0025E4C7E5
FGSAGAFLPTSSFLPALGAVSELAIFTALRTRLPFQPRPFAVSGEHGSNTDRIETSGDSVGIYLGIDGVSNPNGLSAKSPPKTLNY